LPVSGDVVGLGVRQSGCSDESGENQNPVHAFRPSEGECFFYSLLFW
jgi:hypothetical protein